MMGIADSFAGYPTPYYIYDSCLLKQTIATARIEALKYGFSIHYALKANNHPVILSLMQTAGFGADCVSGNEIKAALDAGFSSAAIAFAGVGKTDEEIDFAVNHQIFSFNIESIPELIIINERAGKLGLKANIALRINPNIEANTHKYITTGIEENKFGINYWEISDVIELIQHLDNVNFVGLHFHIGSQITDLNVFKSLCVKVNHIHDLFIDRGIFLQHLNMGGGLGVDYYHPEAHPIPDFNTYFSIFNNHLKRLPGQEIHFELGRSLVAQCGSLITKVLYIKEGAAKKFAIVDAGMTELLRPALYQAFHAIRSLESKEVATEKYDIVGPICESTDIFRKSVEMPELKRGDLLAIKSVGAYGKVMRMSYNMRNEPEEYFL